MAVKDNIAEYMTALGKRRYSGLDVSIIQRAVDNEYKDRKRKGISINFRTLEGRKIIKIRIAEFANAAIKSSRFSHDDIALYRICKEEEYLLRNNKTSWWSRKVNKL